MVSAVVLSQSTFFIIDKLTDHLENKFGPLKIGKINVFNMESCDVITINLV